MGSPAELQAPDAVITVAAALVCRADGRTLLVRKRGTAAFMQPGGKIEPGEAPVDALRRELREEIGLAVETGRLLPLGSFRAPAANEPGRTVAAEVFRIAAEEDIRPAAEIAEIRWIDPARPGTLALAPLTRDHLLPLLVADPASDPCLSAVRRS